jgi:dipeptidase
MMMKKAVVFAGLLMMMSGGMTKINACTNILVTKGASADGSTFISYAADSHDLYGELYYWPAQTWDKGAMLKVYEWDTGKYLGEIPQAEQTYQVIGNMNEHQVSIGETTFGGRPELVDTTGLIDYGSLMYIALQRSKTAREAIEIMTDLVDKYGYYSSGESFSIADPNEVWIMEMIGKGNRDKGAVWVAVRIPDGYISAHANQSRITTFDLSDKDNVIYSKDVISFAREMGYFNGKNKNFSFADAYAPLNFEGVRFCEARVWSAFRHVNKEMDKYTDFVEGKSTDRMPLYIKPDKKVSVRDVQNIMRDHFEGTPLDMTKDAGAGAYSLPYRWRPLTWEVDGKEYFNERAIATQQTGFSFVAQMRSGYHDAIGGILWFGVDDANTTVYVPMYMGMNSVPYNYKVGNGSMIDFSWDSAFWVFTWVSNQSYTRYDLMIDDIRKTQKRLEDQFEAYGAVIDQTAQSLYDKDPALARQFLTEYSHTQARTTIEEWKKLGAFLMVKYQDGNLHPEKNGVFLRNEYGRPAHAQFPGYSEDFYRKIVEETGDKFEMKKLPNEE